LSSRARLRLSSCSRWLSSLTCFCWIACVRSCRSGSVAAQWAEEARRKVESRRLVRTSDSLEKKWTFELSMPRVASRRHIFEAHVNRFPLVLQVHGAKPLDDLAQQASV